MRAFAITDIGLVREENQDCFQIEEFSGMILSVLCDGMGGVSSGAEASAKAANIVFEKFFSSYKDTFNSNSIRNLLSSCVSAANSLVYSEAQLNPEKKGMGTTCVAALISETTAYVVNVGDSRAYLIHESGITQITNDHSVVRMYIEQGKITADEARIHPHKNMLTKAVGVEKSLTPDYFELNLNKGDRILMCSDGLSGFCTDDEIYEVIRNTPDEDIPKALVSLAKSKGGRDNITVIIVNDN